MERSSGTNVGEQIPTDEENMPVSPKVQKRCNGLSESGTSCDVDYDECFFYYFPLYIWEQILVRLPSKSIFRMRCVCKSWHSLTLTPFFVRSYCLLARQRLSSFARNPPWTLLYSFTCEQQFKLIPEERKLSQLCSSDHKSPQFSVLLSTARSQFQIVAENAGLLLLRRSQMHGGDYLVCNPITKKVVAALPPMPCPDTSLQTGREEHHAFHKAYCSWNTYHNSPGLIVTVQDYSFTRYKVVVPVDSNKKVVPAGNLRFSVFCSQHGKWTDEVPIHHRPIYLELSCLSEPVTLNESIYWPDYGRGLLLAYQAAIGNNGEACANLIKVPRIYNGQNQYSMCGSSGGNLRYLWVCSVDGRVMVEVWELEDSNSENWSMKHTSDWSNVWSEDETLCKKLLDASNIPKPRFLPVAFDPFDPDVIYLHDRECIVSYNLQSRRLDTVCDPRSEFLGICWWDMMPFVLPLWPATIP